MTLCSPTENEIALTPTLSQRTGRGGFRSEEFLSYPRPLWGKGEGPLCTQDRNFPRSARMSRRF